MLSRNHESSTKEKKRKLDEEQTSQNGMEAVPEAGERVHRRCDPFYDEKGDLEILTNDDCLFRVHAYQLQAAS